MPRLSWEGWKNHLQSYKLKKMHEDWAEERVAILRAAEKLNILEERLPDKCCLRCENYKSMPFCERAEGTCDDWEALL